MLISLLRMLQHQQRSGKNCFGGEIVSKRRGCGFRALEANADGIETNVVIERVKERVSNFVLRGSGYFSDSKVLFGN